MKVSTTRNRLHIARLHAQDAAQRIRACFTNAGSLVFYASPNVPTHGEVSVQLFTLYDTVRADIWAATDEHSDQLHRTDVISARLRDVYRTAPELFPRAFPAGGALRLTIADALRPVPNLGVDGLVDLIESLRLDWLTVGDLLHDVAIKGRSHQHTDGALDGLDDDDAEDALYEMAGAVAAEANNHGVHGQAAFLLTQIGEAGARTALFDLAAGI
ncbi:hypothetical protein [Micromonospora sp. RV43]|uniref:hypothetical protein n=1 Tax=Micromonospora sp. RV43 TaxID=1661387 RepID=UPI00064B8A88|nr:hypothetical protein [Micromonospora sp. RV43]